MPTDTPPTAAPVLLSELPTADGRRFHVATLNAPASLNALSLPMVQALARAIDAWADDASVAGVVLQGAGGKAFCAGGDVRSLHAALGPAGGSAHPLPRRFFEDEYRLDHHLHVYPKPLLCWGDGIVMGGGVGLLVAASHRVLTPASRLAMPEISLGLYPDVGGSGFLRRAPGRTGLFLGLTGAVLGASDGVYAGWADRVVAPDSHDAVFERIASARWAGDAAADRAQLDRLLDDVTVPVAPGPLRTLSGEIDDLVSGASLDAIAQRLHAVAIEPPADGDRGWLQRAAQTFAKGSPTSAALIHALWTRCAHLPMADVRRLEYDVSLACCDHPDFAEGIRAVLIDKDRRPRWSPPTLAEVSPEMLDDLLRPRHDGAHPLRDLA